MQGADALYIDNKALFNGLLKEAHNTFPELAARIEAAYSEGRGFSLVHRDLELVTQALSRHFKKEFEGSNNSIKESRIGHQNIFKMSELSTSQTLTKKQIDVAKR